MSSSFIDAYLYVQKNIPLYLIPLRHHAHKKPVRLAVIGCLSSLYLVELTEVNSNLATMSFIKGGNLESLFTFVN